MNIKFNNVSHIIENRCIFVPFTDKVNITCVNVNPLI